MPFKNRSDKRKHERAASRRYRQRHPSRLKEAKRAKAERIAWLAIGRKLHDRHEGFAEAGMSIITAYEFKHPYPVTYFIYRGRRTNDNFAIPPERLISQETRQ